MARTRPRGVQRGKAPLRFYIIPQDWGIKGVEDPCREGQPAELMSHCNGKHLFMPGWRDQRVFQQMAHVEERRVVDRTAELSYTTEALMPEGEEAA